MDPRRRPTTGVFLAALGFLLLTHGGHLYASDSLIVHLTATRLLEEGRLDIGEIWGAVVGSDGKRYGRYGLGLSLLQIPLVWAGSVVDTRHPDGFAALAGPGVSLFYPESFTIFAVTLIGPLCGALAAVTLFSLAEAIGYSRRIAALLALLLIVATQTWPASRDGFPHVVVLLLLSIAVRQAVTWSRPVLGPMALGAALGLMLLVRPFDAVLTAPVVLAWMLLRHARDDLGRGVLGRNLAAVAIPLGLAAIVVAAHNRLRFGSVLLFDEPGTQAFNTPAWLGVYGLLLSSGRGLLVYSPPLIAGLCGFPSLARKRPAEAGLLAAVAIALIGGYATYSHWEGGICWGPRYIVPLVPLLLLPAGELLARGGGAAALVLALGAAGILVQVLGTAVDFHRVAHETSFDWQMLFHLAHSPLRVHWDLLWAGRHLDWLPVRILGAQGRTATLAYLAVPTALLSFGLLWIWATWRNPTPAAPVR